MIRWTSSCRGRCHTSAAEGGSRRGAPDAVTAAEGARGMGCPWAAALATMRKNTLGPTQGPAIASSGLAQADLRSPVSQETLQRALLQPVVPVCRLEWPIAGHSAALIKGRPPHLLPWLLWRRKRSGSQAPKLQHNRVKAATADKKIYLHSLVMRAKKLLAVE